MPENITTVGIIAEYNPFHNGHKYQIEEVKRRTDAENIVIAMSGDFMQRGTPAWIDKYLRTKMALENGADFVFELPTAYACASAESFAAAGVSLLTGLGFVDGLCFGAECASTRPLKKAAELLLDPPAAFSGMIKNKIAAGISYPAARESSINMLFPELVSETPNLFSSPNNILAIEYLKAIIKSGSRLTPILIERTDAGYHATSPSETENGAFLSSAAIRELFEKETREQFFEKITAYIPESVKQILEDNPDAYPVSIDDFFDLFYYRLLKLSDEDLKIADMSDEIYHRIQNTRKDYTTVSEYIHMLKTKQYTHTRISRVLLHLLLDIHATGTTNVPYARLLGFREEKSSLLKQVKKIPVITKPADGSAILADHKFETRPCSGASSSETAQGYKEALALYEKDIFAADLYTRIQKKNSPGQELSRGPVII